MITGGKLVSVLVMGTLIIAAFSILLWALAAAGMRITRIVAEPDLNGDGQFTILDLPDAFAASFLAIGNQIQTALAGMPLGRFIEMRSDPPNSIWTFVLSIFAWFGSFGILKAASEDLFD